MERRSSCVLADRTGLGGMPLIAGVETGDALPPPSSEISVGSESIALWVALPPPSD